MKMQKASLIPLLALVTGFGCSLINAPDELLPAEEGDGDGDGDLGGGPGDGDGDTGGGSGDGDGDMPEPPMPPTTGLIVLSAVEAETDDRVLITLSATDGAELSRETVPAVSVAYDEAPGRFVWFILTSANTSPGANTLAELQVRRYDDETDTWTTLSKTSALPPPLLRGTEGAAAGPRPTSQFRPIVLNNRLVYISQTIESGNPVQSITVLDTTDLEDVQLVESLPVPMDEQILGLVGRRGTELDAEAPGGAVSMMVAQTCDMDTGACQLAARPVTVSGSVAPLAANGFGSFAGVPAFTSTPVLPESEERPFKNAIPSLGAYAMAFDPVTMDPRWWGFDPADPASKDTPSSLADSTADSFAGLAVSECRAAAIASTGGMDPDDFNAIHLANAAVISSSIDDSGRDVLIEPFRGNVLTMRSMDDTLASVRAFQIEVLSPGTASERISLAERSVWKAPTDVLPISFAVRLPPTPSCN